MPDPLTNAVWASLWGTHRSLAEWVGSAARYPTDVTPFAALPDDAGPDAWDDLAVLAGPEGHATLFREGVDLPSGWEVAASGDAVQMVRRSGTALPPTTTEGRGPVEVETLSVADADDMMALVARTQPGPFLARTPMLGSYVGVRGAGGHLVAMAGQRLRPPGYTEISAVCTDAEARGRGLATRLLAVLVAEIESRAETPMLHVAAGNRAALRLYEHLGFHRTRLVSWMVVLPPR